MKISIRLLCLAVLLALIMFGCVGTSKDSANLRKTVVENLKVQDIPNDGGDGLMVSWKPLAKSHRIQEYRVYRGVHPDSLFFIASVPVNVKTGVASDMMYYYDSGWNTLIDNNTPGHLKHEKKNKNTILYRGVPRDFKLAARLSSCYNLLSSLEDKYYYFHALNSRSANPEDEAIYAGLDFSRQTILSSLKTKEEGKDPIYYYYSVVPVNEQFNYLGIAKPVKSYPEDNVPEKSPGFYCAAITDKGSLQFEWELPLNNDDIAAYSIIRLPEAVEATWKDLSPADRELLMQQQGSLMQQEGVIDPRTGLPLKNYCTLEFDPTDPTKNPGGLSWDEALRSKYLIQFQDAVGTSALDEKLTSPLSKTSADLPQKTNFRVEDKPMDKGDRLSIIWEEPIVQITNTTSLNKAGTKLKVNYQINMTDAQKVGNIYFEFFAGDAKTPFAKVNEFFHDNLMKINIPEKYSIVGKSGQQIAGNRIKVRMTLSTKKYSLHPKTGRLKYDKAKLVKDYELVQYLEPDPVMMAYMPTPEFFRNGVDISKLKNVIYRRNFRNPDFDNYKTNTSFENSMDITVGYVLSLTKQVLGFNYVEGDSLHTIASDPQTGAMKHYVRQLKKGERRHNTVLLPSEIDVVYDAKNQKTLRASIFASEARKTLENMQSKVRLKQNELITKMNDLRTAPADSVALRARLDQEIPGLVKAIEDQEKQITMYKQNPVLSKVMKSRTNRGMMSYIASIREPETRSYSYMVVRTDGKGLYTEAFPDQDKNGEYTYFLPISNWFDWNKLVTLIAVLIFGAFVVIFVNLAKRGKDLYMRPIAGLEEIDNAIGRATEMGRPMLYCMGNGGLSDVATLASMGILGLVARKAAEYDTKLIVPCYDYIVMPIAQEIVREAHYAVGRPDSFDKNNVFYLTSVQFAYVAGVNGIMIRERMATNFFMGYFAAEALLMTETGNAVGAVQIAGSDAITQIPFFITTCDYTLIGEELYAASAYLNREPMLLGTLKGQDYFKFIILILVITGALLATFQVTGLMQLFPLK